MKKSAAFLFSVVITMSMNLYAHGEDKPGPHGGYIRMPGAFHTEVIKEKDGFRVYLLDLNWKNPSVLDSSVSASIQVGKKKTDLICTQESDSFLCKSSLPQKGDLNIKARREGQTGGISSYKLPLKFDSPQNEMPEHKGH